MTYGFDLGRIKSTTTGASYVDKFAHSGGTTNKTYTSPAFEFATAVRAVVTPGVNVPASTIPSFPTITTSVNNATKTLSVSASGGNIQVNVLVFVR